MAPGLRLLCARCWTEGIEFAECHRSGFDVKLSRLGEIRLIVKIVDWKQRAGTLAGHRCEDRRIGERESALIKEIARSFDNLGSRAQDGGLTRSAHPEMAVLHEEIDAMLLQRDRKRLAVWHALHDLHIADIKFVAAGRALVSANFAGDDHTGFLREMLHGIEHFG